MEDWRKAAQVRNRITLNRIVRIKQIIRDRAGKEDKGLVDKVPAGKGGKEVAEALRAVEAVLEASVAASAADSADAVAEADAAGVAGVTTMRVKVRDITYKSRRSSQTFLIMLTPAHSAAC